MVYIRVKLNPRQKMQRKETTFLRNYYYEKGIPWVHYWPREPPLFHMYETEYLGQRYKIQTEALHLEQCSAERMESPDFVPDVPSTKPDENHCFMNNCPEIEIEVFVMHLVYFMSIMYYLNMNVMK
eukprot:UN26309